MLALGKTSQHHELEVEHAQREDARVAAARARRADRLERFMNPSQRMYGQDFAALDRQVEEKRLAAERLAEEEAKETARRMALVAAAEAQQAKIAADRKEAAAATLRAQQQQARDAALRTTADLTDKDGASSAVQEEEGGCRSHPSPSRSPSSLPRSVPALWAQPRHSGARPTRALLCAGEAAAAPAPAGGPGTMIYHPRVLSSPLLPRPAAAQIFSGEDPLARERARLQASQMAAWTAAAADDKARRRDEEAARDR